MEKIDLDLWPRKDSFDFFKEYQNPYFNVCTKVPVTSTYNYLEKHSISKFRAMMFLICKAANTVEEMRSRIQGDDVVIHEKVNVSFTLLNDDKTLTFCNTDYIDDADLFFKNVERSIASVDSNLAVADEECKDNVMFVSCVPWIDFTSITHPMKMDGVTDSIPRLSWGKFTCVNDEWVMPVSLQLHHGLADGYHAGLFFSNLEKLLREPETIAFPKH